MIMGNMLSHHIPETQFLFMRHAQSVENAQGIIPHGHACSGLTLLGRNQVLEVGGLLKDTKHTPTCIFASPIMRAAETAEIMAGLFGLKVKFLPELREHELGEWEGKPWQEVEPFFEERAEPPGGETYATFHARLKKALDRIAREPGHPLVVAHGGVWHGLRALCGDHGTDWPPNAGIASVVLGRNSRHFNPLVQPMKHIIRHGIAAFPQPGVE